jgi:phosphoribosylaminoimidazole-succinocarboxamide synthase
VRDIYEVDGDRLLMITSDRISAFDCVLPNAIPHKGRVLTQLSKFWFDRFSHIVANHLITAELDEFPKELLERITTASNEYPPAFPAAFPAASPAAFLTPFLEGRSMLVYRADVIPFECVVRGYLAGSGWKEYRETGAICGHHLPPDLLESDRLPEPIFTPATKAEEGHDINIPISEMSRSLGSKLTDELEALSLRLYGEAATYAESRGIIICDTKFEFGVRDGKLLLVDEALTPDSSRFWPRDAYTPGKPVPSFDKQFVRDYLETLDWDKRPPAPSLPPQVVEATSTKYLEAFRLITGHTL